MLEKRGSGAPPQLADETNIFELATLHLIKVRLGLRRDTSVNGVAKLRLTSPALMTYIFADHAS